MEEVDQGPEQVREIVLEPGLAQQLSEDVEDVVQRPFAGLRLRQGAGIGLVLVRPVAVERQFVEQIRSEEHTSELQSLMRISYAVFCLKTKKSNTQLRSIHTE